MENDYISSGTNYYSISGTATWDNNISQGCITVKSSKEGIHPILAFKYIKSKFGMLENLVMKRRLDKLEKAFYQAVDNGQEALGEKLIKEMARETKESVLYAKGIKYFVEKDDIWKHKNDIQGGHISDTPFESYTRVIPKDVIKKKKAVEGLFDGFVILHYYEEEIENKRSKKQKMSSEEKNKMRDPILFGWVKETSRWYFIADWEDEYCDLTFDEIVDVVGENKLSKYPNLKNN